MSQYNRAKNAFYSTRQKRLWTYRACLSAISYLWSIAPSPTVKSWLMDTMAGRITLHNDHCLLLTYFYLFLPYPSTTSFCHVIALPQGKAKNKTISATSSGVVTDHNGAALAIKWNTSLGVTALASVLQSRPPETIWTVIMDKTDESFFPHLQ